MLCLVPEDVGMNKGLSSNPPPPPPPAILIAIRQVLVELHNENSSGMFPFANWVIST